MSILKTFVAAKAFINCGGKVLVLRESPMYQDSSHLGKFDVPGGRLIPGEGFYDSLLREIKEETGLENVEIGRPFFINEWRPKKGDEEWHIIGIYVECFSETQDVKLSQDHSEFKWINPKDYKNYELIENSLKVFDEYLKFK